MKDYRRNFHRLKASEPPNAATTAVKHLASENLLYAHASASTVSGLRVAELEFFKCVTVTFSTTTTTKTDYPNRKSRRKKNTITQRIQQ